MSNPRPVVWDEVGLPVEVKDEVIAEVGDPVIPVTVNVVDGMNGGVGENIAGGRDGEKNGVFTATVIFIPLQDANRRASHTTGTIFVIFTSNPGNCIGNSHQKHLIF